MTGRAGPAGCAPPVGGSRARSSLRRPRSCRMPPLVAPEPRLARAPSAARRSRAHPERPPVGEGRPPRRDLDTAAAMAALFGTALLARSAFVASPELSMTASPVPNAVATTVSGIGASSRRLKVRNDSRIRRMDEESKRWRGRPRNPPTSVPRSTPRTSLRRREDQRRAISAMPGRSGRLAKNAPLMAPTDVPTIIPGRSPLSTRAYIIPTWIAPRLPPPLSTNAGDPGASAVARARPAPGAVATAGGPAVTQRSR